MEELGFMVFGLGFFIFAVNVVLQSSREHYQHSIMEAREFGFRGTRHKRLPPNED